MVVITDGAISKCSNSGDVSLTGQNARYGVGGIVGCGGSNLCDTRIEYCYNEGKVTLELVNSNTIQVAGIVANLGMDTSGLYTGYVISCYNKGEIKCIGSASNGYAAGIGSWGRNIIVRNCYNSGKITKEDRVVADGIWDAYDTTLDSEFENNYWLDSCGADYGIRQGHSNVGAKPKTETEFKSLATILGEDYAQSEKINDGYPYLKENRP